MNAKEYKLSFAELVSFIQHVHVELSAQAGRAVNLSLTLRNWLIGLYIAEYEQRGTDRAEYGARLLENLSSRLGEIGLDGVAPRSLRQYRQFYLIYPGIWQTPSAKSLQSLIPSSIRQTLPAKSPSDSADTGSQIAPTTSAQFVMPAAKLIQKLSFRNFAELISIDDSIKRAFYEI